jgi:hypothetical protein
MRLMIIFSFALLLLLQAAFEFLALLYKPTVIWVLVPALTVVAYIVAFVTRRAFGWVPIIISLAISIFLTYDITFGYIQSISGGSNYPLTNALYAAILYFVVSNVLVLAGAWLIVRTRAAARQ